MSALVVGVAVLLLGLFGGPPTLLIDRMSLLRPAASWGRNVPSPASGAKFRACKLWVMSEPQPSHAVVPML
jgi:hypothetical protein